MGGEREGGGSKSHESEGGGAHVRCTTWAWYGSVLCCIVLCGIVLLIETVLLSVLSERGVRVRVGVARPATSPLKENKKEQQESRGQRMGTALLGPFSYDR